MNRNIILIVAAVAIAGVAFIAGRGSRDDVAQSTGGESGREIVYWVAPMDPNYRRDEPGKSPMGMDLIPVYADELDGKPGVTTIDPIIVNNLGVRTELARVSPLTRRIDTVGYVSYDEDTVEHVHTRVDGWIEVLAKTATGDRVETGELLFEIYSPTLVNAQEEYLAALRSGNSVLSDASKERLEALGFSASEITRLGREKQVTRRVPVFAESDGVIAHLGVREGIFVTPATEVMSVARFDSVWVVADVLERQATWVAPGQTASVELESVPGTVLQSVVDYIYPELDPVTRTLKVRLRFDNPSENLRPNMFARISIEGRSTGDIVNVPKQAVIRSGTGNRVVVDIGDGRFESRSVLVGIESGDRVAIRRGLRKGERVVTSAQFLIDSESNVGSALGRMDDGGNEQ